MSGDDVVATPSSQSINVPTYTANLSGNLPRTILNGNWFTVNSSAPVARVTPTALNFGTQVVGGSAPGLTVAVANVSNASTMTISSITVSGAGFVQSNNCQPAPYPLAAGGTCTITVNFLPQASPPVAYSGTLTINDDGGGPHLVPLSGTAVATSPVPTIISLQPGQLLAGSAGFSLVVIGGTFVPGSQVYWNGSARQTTYISEGVLLAAIGATDVATPGAAAITVVNPPPGGGTSNAYTFAVANSPIPTANYSYIVPHIVSGAGFVTKSTIVNLSLAPNNVTVNTLSQSGQWLDSQSYTMTGSGNLRQTILTTAESQRFGPAQVKWAVVGSQSPLAINTFFEIGQSSSAGVTIINAVGFNDAPQGTEFTLPVELEPGPTPTAIGRTVGLAVANLSAQTNTVTLKLYDHQGALLGTRTVPLTAFAQTAFDVGGPTGFSSVLPAGNFVGTLVFTSTQPIGAIGVGDDFGPFSAIPVIRGKPQ